MVWPGNDNPKRGWGGVVHTLRVKQKSRLTLHALHRSNDRSLHTGVCRSWSRGVDMKPLVHGDRAPLHDNTFRKRHQRWNWARPGRLRMEHRRNEDEADRQTSLKTHICHGAPAHCLSHGHHVSTQLPASAPGKVTYSLRSTARCRNSLEES